MRVGLVRVNPDARPHVGLALRHRDDRVPFLLAGRDVEEAGHAARARRVEHLALPLGEPVIDQVAMAIDQAHDCGELEPREGRRRLRDRRAVRTAGDQVEQARGRARDDRGDRGGEPAHRLDDRAEHARHPLGIGLLEPPRRHRCRHRHCRRTPRPSTPRSPPRRRSGRTRWPARCSPGRPRRARRRPPISSPAAGRMPSKFLNTIDKLRCARLPKLLASSALTRATSASSLTLPSWPKLTSRIRK